MRSINTISRDFNPKELMESLYQNKDAIVDCINKVFFEEYIHPMQKQIEKYWLTEEIKKTIAGG